MSVYYPSGGYFPDFVVIKDSGRRSFRHTPVFSSVLERRALPRNPTAVFFSGFAVVGEELVFTAERFTSTALIQPRELIRSSYPGCYTVVIDSNDILLIANDLFGLCPIYYFCDEQVTIASNRVHLIATLLELKGITRRPNFEVVCTGLASSHIMFLHPYSHDTVLSGLRICPVDSMVMVSGDGRVHLVPKPEHYELSSDIFHSCRSHGRYSDVIARAAEEIKANVRAVLNSRVFSHHILDISGGKDSRLVFGAVASQNLLSRCSARTATTRSVGDLEIGAGIANLYGARVDSTTGTWRFSKNSRFVLGFWRSMIAGMRHDVGASNWPAMWQGGTVRLNGGCGEIYRDFWAENRLLNRISADRFNDLCRPGSKSGLRSIAFNSLWRAIRSMPGDTAAAKIRNHYMFFRSRFHFGIPAYNEWGGYVPFSPLQSAALLSASRLLDPAACSCGRAIYDVLEHVMPELNHLPFAGGKCWPIEFLAQGRGGRVAPRRRLPRFAGKLQRAYETAEISRKESLRSNSIHVDQIAESIKQALWFDATVALSRMRETGRDMALFFDDSFCRWFSDLWFQSKADAAAAASKILSVYDLCFDREVSVLDLSGLPYREAYLQAAFSSVTCFNV